MKSMPLFDFLCRGCKHEFEGLVRSGQAPACPQCQSQDLERLPATFGMSSLDHTKELVKAERKKLAPKHQAERQEEFQHTLKEHLHD